MVTATHERINPVTAPFQTLQTYATDFGIPGILDAAITGLTVLDPTENNEPDAPSRRGRPLRGQS